MKKVLIAAGVVVVIAVIVIASVSRRRTPGEKVYAGDVGRGDVVTVVTGTGVIQPRTKVNISSEVYGQIVEIPVKEGQTVRKGELLVRIDPEKYRSDVDRLAANVRVSRIAIESEDASLRNLELDKKRARELHRQGVLSSSELERADLAVETSVIRLKSLREEVTQAEAALKRVNDDLGKTTIYAPMSGKVTQVSTEVGEQVIVGTTNIPGSVIMVISDMSEVLAEVNVDETEVVRLGPGQKAQVSADAIEKSSYDGQVTEIKNTASRQGDVNVFGVKILIDRPDERLRPGMTAKAKIEVDRRENVLRVPIQAVTTRERKKLEEDRKSAGLLKSQTTNTAGAGSSRSAVAAEGGTSEGKDAGGPGGEASTAKGTEAGEGGIGIANASTRTPSDTPTSSAGNDGRTAAKSRDAAASTRKDAKDTSGGEKAKQGSGSGKGDREEIEVVYVIEDGVVRAVPVKTGASEETYVEIVSGLKEGQALVTGPYRILKRLKEGDRVIRDKESEPSEDQDEDEGESRRAAEPD